MSYENSAMREEEEKLQNWLSTLAEKFENFSNKKMTGEQMLNFLAPDTKMLIDYFMLRYQENPLDTVVAKLLSIYYKSEIARCFVIQFLPLLITVYLRCLHCRKFLSCQLLEIPFLAIYNEDVLADSSGTTKRPSDSVLRSSSRNPPAVESNTSKQSMLSKIVDVRQRNSNSIASRFDIRPSVERVNAENRFLILTHLIASMRKDFDRMAPSVVFPLICHSAIEICWTGFSFTESTFRTSVLREKASAEIFDGYEKKPRIPVTSRFMVECLNGISLALFSGYADIALRALDVVHQRAQYEMFCDVLLETNALRHTLTDRQLRTDLVNGHDLSK